MNEWADRAEEGGSHFLLYNFMKLSDGSLARELFEDFREDFERVVAERFENIDAKEEVLGRADELLSSWSAQRSGVPLAYSKESLARALLGKDEAEKYVDLYSPRLISLNTLHEGLVRYAIQKTGLAKALIGKGKAGEKLAVIETCSRLSPALTFMDASNYLSAMVAPYSKEARAALGEKTQPPYVSEKAAMESCMNAYNRWGAKRVIAETSAAPRSDIVKSGKKPQVFVCSLVEEADGSPKINVTHHTIDTPFRDEFDAVVREIMYCRLRNMYNLGPTQGVVELTRGSGKD